MEDAIEEVKRRELAPSSHESREKSRKEENNISNTINRMRNKKSVNHLFNEYFSRNNRDAVYDILHFCLDNDISKEEKIIEEKIIEEKIIERWQEKLLLSVTNRFTTEEKKELQDLTEQLIVQAKKLGLLKSTNPLLDDNGYLKLNIADIIYDNLNSPYSIVNDKIELTLNDEGKKKLIDCLQQIDVEFNETEWSIYEPLDPITIIEQ